MVRAYDMMRVGSSEYLGATRTIKEKIAKMRGVLKVEMIFGRFDIIAEVEAKDLKNLDRITDKLKNLPSVLSTESFICY